MGTVAQYDLLVDTGIVKPKSLSYEDGSVLISTLEGDMKCSLNDYIIIGVKGEAYPCKPDIFELTYETAQTFNEVRDVAFGR